MVHLQKSKLQIQLQMTRTLVYRHVNNGENKNVPCLMCLIALLFVTGHKQAHVFNNQAYVFVGGRRERNGTISKPFQGIISGMDGKCM
jgi:hypothetical protein